ncbi:hypothetical protein MHLP_00470 [Candidatus Mycoplasma haematolamae str. Purdue]|uniref:Uncharacterized protein n=1 Tax=Mycoplasma haematolamae (strain Purdue) TaxID=1212765 RepID=I7CII6_MYCHA|nr:hypothetical protein [Candidatus Mycoplasma haematolamae]AFO51674.1 hypothetical protein MHLP_00470 [Candidatus Mycoplasma haematolamae str. Purdue]
MNWTKNIAYAVAFLSGTGTVAKVTYDYSVPSGGKLVKAKKDHASGQEVGVWLPDSLAKEIPEKSKLQMVLGIHKSGEKGECINVSYQGDASSRGGVILQGTLANHSDLRNMTICNGQEIWTVTVKEKEENKKIRCPYGYGLTTDSRDGRKLLKCRTDRRNTENEELNLEGIKCKKELYKNLFVCTADSKVLSTEYTALPGASNRQDPAIELKTN